MKFVKAQNEISTPQKFTNLQIVGDLSANTTCRLQLLGCCDQLAEGVSRVIRQVSNTLQYLPMRPTFYPSPLLTLEC